jgi:CRISPR system Cascade subunit CasC
MKLVELHLLQSFPVTCLNRDDVGSPKSAIFGGIPRARVSSQCWKRAIRQAAKDLSEERCLPRFQGIRTTRIAEIVEKKLAERLKNEKQIKPVADIVVNRIASSKNDETAVLLYMSPKQAEQLAVAISEIPSEELDKIIATEAEKRKKKGKEDSLDKALKCLKTPPEDAADIAIFGRMVASDPGLTLEGAGMFSHALSTHEVANEIDFFSAVDDLQPREEAGAGHIGTLEFNSACYYRYVGLNWDLLSDKDHLGTLSEADRKAILSVFLQAAIQAVPQARKNSMFGHSLPSVVLGLVRDGQPLSLMNAFEKPVRAGHDGYITRSREQLEQHYAFLNNAFSLNPSVEVWLILDHSQKNPPNVGTLVNTLDDFIKQLLEGLQ